MAHLWFRDASEKPAGESSPSPWSPMPLEGAALAIFDSEVCAGAVCRAPGDASADASAQLLGCKTSDGDTWVIIGSPAVHVNGHPLDTGIRVLRDRDELRAGGSRTFFSTESLAEIVPFPGSERPTFCPRSKLEIAPGSPAVACPQCKVWHHQSDELPCWTYSERCAMCDQPTALDAGFRWTPEHL